MKPHRHVRWLWRELWSRRAVLGAALLCTAAAAGLYILMPEWASQLVNEVLGSRDVGALSVHMLKGLGIFLAGSILTFGSQYLMKHLSFSITADTRDALFRHILQASPRTLASVGGGQLVSSFSNDLQTFQEALTKVVASFLPSIILVLVFAGAMLYYSWILFLCTALLISPLILVTSFFGNKLHGAAHTTQDRLAGLIARFEEMLDGAREIKSFNREADIVSRFDALNVETLSMQLQRERYDSAHPAVVAMAAGSGIAGMVLLSAFLLYRNLLSLETLTAFLVCVAIAYSPMQEAAHAVGRLLQLSAILDRFERILALKPETGGTLRLQAGSTAGELKFEDIGFRYSPDGFAFEGFDLTIPAGQRVAIVGPSGGGKSTLLDMVPRFLEPDSGRLLVDGVDAAELSLADLRQEIGVVFQQPVLFEGSLLENLRFGAPQADMDAVLRAAAAAHVDEFARRLPQGYDTILAPRGSNLSVGQRQRIAIARVLLKDPGILLLDEPTSALDAESERLVRDALERVSEGRTTLIVAHRLSTVRAVDRIIVLERGRLVEDGTHDELFARDGLYRRLCAEQLVEGDAP